MPLEHLRPTTATSAIKGNTLRVEPLMRAPIAPKTTSLILLVQSHVRLAQVDRTQSLDRAAAVLAPASLHLRGVLCVPLDSLPRQLPARIALLEPLAQEEPPTRARLALLVNFLPKKDLLASLSVQNARAVPLANSQRLAHLVVSPAPRERTRGRTLLMRVSPARLGLTPMRRRAYAWRANQARIPQEVLCSAAHVLEESTRGQVPASVLTALQDMPALPELRPVRLACLALTPTTLEWPAASTATQESTQMLADR